MRASEANLLAIAYYLEALGAKEIVKFTPFVFGDKTTS